MALSEYRRGVPAGKLVLQPRRSWRVPRLAWRKKIISETLQSVGSLEPPWGRGGCIARHRPQASSGRPYRRRRGRGSSRCVTMEQPRLARPDSNPRGVLRQLCLPLRGAWALSSPGLPWTGPGDLTTHHATNCTSCLDSDPYATRAAAGRGTQPGSAGRQPAAELRDSPPYATCAAAGRGTQPGSAGRQPAAGAT